MLRICAHSPLSIHAHAHTHRNKHLHMAVPHAVDEASSMDVLIMGHFEAPRRLLCVRQRRDSASLRALCSAPMQMVRGG